VQGDQEFRAEPATGKVIHAARRARERQLLAPG